MLITDTAGADAVIWQMEGHAHLIIFDRFLVWPKQFYTLQLENLLQKTVELEFLAVEAYYSLYPSISSFTNMYNKQPNV